MFCNNAAVHDQSINRQHMSDTGDKTFSNPWWFMHSMCFVLFSVLFSVLMTPTMLIELKVWKKTYFYFGGWKWDFLLAAAHTLQIKSLRKRRILLRCLIFANYTLIFILCIFINIHYILIDYITKLYYFIKHKGWGSWFRKLSAFLKGVHKMKKEI